MIPAADARMAESTSVASQTNTSPLTGPSSFGSAFDAQGLPTVHEVAYHKTSHDFTSIDRRPSMRRPSADSAVGSHHGSAGSSVGRTFDESLLEVPPPPLPYGSSAPASSAAPNSNHSFEDKRETMTNGNGHGTANGDQGQHRQQHQQPAKTEQHRRLSKAKGSRKDKKGGFRSTIKRILGIQRSPKDRISMPNPMVYPHHDPEEFITSATAVNAKVQRSASVPANILPRRSALNSHPPSSYTPAPAPPSQNENVIPPQPERRPPERPPRPRSQSVPSVLITNIQAFEAAMATEQNTQDKIGPNVQDVELQNIGFAVTNGSNPKRRSRSVGAYPSVDHRMSPIQWHHIRRRSDEIRYWRESTHLSSFGGLKSIGSPEATSPVLAKADLEGTEDEEANGPTEDVDLGQHNEHFNFGIPADTSNMQNQDRMGLEERLITLEIKLMDFEYALSKLQAGSSSSQRNSNVAEGKHMRLVDSYSSLNAQQTPIEASPTIQQGPIPHSISHKPSVENLMNPKPRPTSVATTIKQGYQSGIYTSQDRPPTDRAMRASLTNLTIEHYTTLISLIRHEQSARQRLEEQVVQLQAQVDRQATQQSNLISNPPSSQLSHTFSQSSRRHGMVDADNRRLGPYIQQQRPRSSSYSTVETTDDESDYHDVYVTPDITPIEHPVERGEYERGAFDRMPVGEGVAF